MQGQARALILVVFFVVRGNVGSATVGGGRLGDVGRRVVGVLVLVVCKTKTEDKGADVNCKALLNFMAPTAANTHPCTLPAGLGPVLMPIITHGTRGRVCPALHPRGASVPYLRGW